MNRRTIGFILALIILACACNLVESPLSDTPISDPSLLQIIAIADRDISSGGLVVTTLRANLYDKHGYYVRPIEISVPINPEGDPLRVGMFHKEGIDTYAMATFRPVPQ